MPRKPIDYSNTHFYRIVCKDLEITDCYVGHTTDFTKRKNKHKSVCSNEKDTNFNLPVYQFIRMNGGWKNWDMVLIETKQCESSLEAKRHERCFIEKLKASLNQIQPLKTEEERKEYKHNWHYQNRDRLCSEKKEKYQQDREEIIAKNRKYYQDNIEERRETRNRKCNCECGDIYTYANKKRHERSNKHQEYLKSLVID